MHPLETYLTEIATLRGATKETSGYGVLQNLLNAAGHPLKPKVKCIIHPKNTGAGIPDGGLFLPEQLKQHDEAENFGELIPARGVIEVKSVGEDIADFAESPQVEKYLGRYGQVLLTNYREFLLLKRIGGKTQKLEGFQLAPDEKSFWLAAAHPRKTADALGERCAEYLKRVMLHNAPLNNPKDVAFFLASYARDARARVENAGDLPALAAVRGALEEALGMKFEAEKGEHFFRSTLVQTLFYGVFSAWVLWHKEKPQRKNDFDWKSAAWTLHVPMIKALFEQVATPTKLGPLGLVEVLDWTAAALNRVDRAAFFEKFLESHAVQYFYEPFLEAFDSELRKQLGVWYTPPEIVQYQVARVDAALRDKDGLNIPDGLADPRVFVLDIACGTGAYVIEVLRVIAQTLKEEKGEGDALNAEAVKEAAQKRVFGFEIMPAPFVVAHLQMGLLLQNLGVPLDDAKGERAGIFLTNSLTGWDFAGENPKLANWPELAAERAGAGNVKQKKPILVIISNPPYNAFAGISPEEEQGLVDSYKEGLVKVWGIKKFNLDDLYVRFFRLAERRIAEKTGLGIVSFISNFSYLSDPSFVVMRQRFLQEFDSLWFDCLNGDSRETGKLTPEGKPDPSVFSTEYNREGIRVGTAIATMIRRRRREESQTSKKKSKSLLTSSPTSKIGDVFFRQFWGADKRAELLESLKAKKFAKQYENVKPTKENRFSFCPSDVTGDYHGWPRLTELCAEAPSNGLMEKRAGALIDIDRMALEKRMLDYYDPNVSWDELKILKTGLTEDAARFDAKKAREKVTAAEDFESENLRRYALRPFDTRWCYFSSERPLWNEPRPTLWQQCWKGNSFLLTRMNCPRSPEGAPMSFTACLSDDHYLTPDAVAIPFRLRAALPTKLKKKDDGNGEFKSVLHEAAPAYHAGKITANLSPAARAYLAKLGIKNPDDDADTAALIWMHALAIGYSPAYLAENADGVRQDWPRIPLPDSKVALLASAELGKQVAVLLDTETPVQGVTAGKVRAELVKIAVVTRLTRETLNLSVTAGWGHAGQNGVTMPGKGKLATRPFTADEAAAFGARVVPTRSTPASTSASEVSEPSAPANALRVETTRAPSELLGPATHDIFLNEAACWSNVPEKVW
ncbi:MAG TPA: DNA methyltransferase, partial [Verrucomicrobia subdivision 3 bacterium]|nr:DNA methyltransferase [Limisphaerales bacterium]